MCSSQSENWNQNLQLRIKADVFPPLLVRLCRCGAALTFPPRSMVSCTFFRKSLSLHLLESRMVVAYVDSEMRMSGRHLSIQAALRRARRASGRSRAGGKDGS